MPEQDHSTVQAALVEILRRAADYFATLPPGDAAALVNGDLELRLSVGVRKRRPSGKTHKADTTDLVEIVSKLRSFENRRDGELLLKDVAPTRRTLEALARHIDIPVRKSERAEEISRRIVESTIGYRLASAAIQGQSSKQSREGNAIARHVLNDRQKHSGVLSKSTQSPVPKSE
jgi:hypothetical protein